MDLFIINLEISITWEVIRVRTKFRIVPMFLSEGDPGSDKIST
jgi:hypothetical protein